MQTTIRLNTEELTMDFLNGLKTMFRGKEITLTVETAMDETEYLLSNEANKKFIDKSIEQLTSGEIVYVNMDDLKK